MELVELRDRLLAQARADGWAAAGIAGLTPLEPARRRALDAIAAGRMTGMAWFSAERVEHAADLKRRYPWASAAVALAWPYRPNPASPPGGGRGRMAAYALTTDSEAPVDYHDLLASRCRALAAWLAREAGPGKHRAKVFVDHGWALDRALAERAGIGFCGKNTCLITLEAGSYVLLAEILTSIPLPPTAASHRGCGECSACLPACPTGALVAPGVMDAPRCISYLTIEHRGSIPEAQRPLIGTWVFGCDLCQEACPINQRLAPAAAAIGGGSTARGPVPFPDLVELLQLDQPEFARRFKGTAVARTGRDGLARNAAIALGNSGQRDALPALDVAAAGDPDPVVRESAAWAAARLRGQATRG